MSAADDGEMTLVFALSVLERLAQPAEAVVDAQQWSVHVGVVGDDPDEVARTLEREGIDPDFVSGKRGEAGTLAAVRQRFPADRHVFLGTTDVQRETAQALGWEFLPIEEAAADAEWALADRD